MKKIIITAFIMLIASFVYCWSSVGFKIEDHDLIKEYKLPSWGYSISSVAFSGRSNFLRRETAYKRIREDYSLNISPDYTRTFESDNNSYAFNIVVNTHFGYSKDQDEEHEIDEIARSYELFPRIHGNYNFYIKDDFFMNFSLTSQLSYREINASPDDQDRIQRRMNSTSFLGIGFGRIRDVSPIFRALRLRERVEALNKGMTLSENQIKELADKFAQYHQFASVYNRHEKYFWKEISPILGNEFSALNISENLYLTEVMQEHITRRQGNEILLGINLWHSYINERDDNIIKELYLGPSISFNYYNNVNLKYQIVVSSTLSYGKYFTEDSTEDSNLIFDFSNSHLFEVTDRIRWNSNVVFNYNYYWYEDIDGYKFNVKLSTSIDYYIEDNFSLYCQISSELKYVDKDLYEYDDYNLTDLKREERARFYFGCRYYFRNMF